MDDKLLNEIKENLKNSIYNYLKGFKYKNVQPLDILIPKERKVRSVVGGLETSMGTTVWEPIAKTLAKNNGFEILDQKILKPSPMPPSLVNELSILISDREGVQTWVPASECKTRLRRVATQLPRSATVYVKPPAGSGVDIFLKKDGKYYAFDIKTVQPNVGSIKTFNKQILEWYAYSIFKEPDIDIYCSIAYPYNPYEDNFWNHTPHTSGILEPRVDALVENEFWDFISGVENTYQVIHKILIELNLEGFGRELSLLIEKIYSPVENVV
jgi:hypothetical protein